MATSPGSAQRPMSNATGRDRLAPIEAQLLCRAINEQIRTGAEDFASADEIDLVCECSQPGRCWELLHVSASDYEGVRRFPTRFLVRPSHVSDETERIVADRSGFMVVEKVGSDAELAIQRDPRELNDRTNGRTPVDAHFGETRATVRELEDNAQSIIRYRRPKRGGTP